MINANDIVLNVIFYKIQVEKILNSGREISLKQMSVWVKSSDIANL